MAAQYGTGEALLAAVASTAALLIGNIPDQPIDQDIYAYILELARNPILWLLTVVFIGEIGRRHRNRIAELSGRLVETEQHIGTLDDASRRQAEANTRLHGSDAGPQTNAVATHRK